MLSTIALGAMSDEMAKIAANKWLAAAKARGWIEYVTKSGKKGYRNPTYMRPGAPNTGTRSGGQTIKPREGVPNPWTRSGGVNLS
jgi:hypothetical protein